jgi:hypothetical protein
MIIILILIVLIYIYGRQNKTQAIGKYLLANISIGRHDRHYVGKRIVGTVIRPRVDIGVTHMGSAFVEDDPVRAGIWNESLLICDTIITKNCSQLGDFRYNSFGKFCPLRAGQVYIITSVPDLQPVVEAKPINPDIEILGRCWGDSIWAFPTTFRMDGSGIFGPNLIYDRI